MTTKTSIKLTMAAQKNVINYLNSVFFTASVTSARLRLEKIDKAMQMESEKRRTARTDYFTDTEIPLMSGPVSKLSNFLIDLFVGIRIFELVNPDDNAAEIVKQANAIIDENSRTSGWATQMILFLRDIAKYPYAFISCEWEREEVTALSSDNTNPNANASGVTTSFIGRQGNVLKRIDPYNCGWDTSVSINELSKKGEFFHYTERLSQVALFKEITNLKLGNNQIMNEHRIWSRGSVDSNRYYTPDIKPEFESKTRDTKGWAGFFEGTIPEGKTSKQRIKAMSQGDLYERTILYARIIPSQLGIKVPAADKVQIWKFYVVNWDLVYYAERQTNVHSLIPVAGVQITDEGLREQAKSIAEKLVPMQNLSTHLHDLNLAALKRGVSDRAIYDKSRIDESDLSSDIPDAKIAVKPSILKTPLSEAYRSIPFDNNMAPQIYQSLGFIANSANEAAGFNRPQQGQFQKGNKTLGEFTEIMNNADDDLRTFAKLVDSVGLNTIKTIIKINMLQYQLPTTVADKDSQQVKVNPADLRRTGMQFKLADGLNTKEQLLDLPTANTMLNLILQMGPELAARYDIVKMIEHIFSSVGFDTSKFNNGGQGGQPPTTPTPQGDTNES